MSDTPDSMSSNRPYLLRAIYDWISDNGCTPYLLIDATYEGVRVPPQVVKNGQVVLNIAMRAVANLELGNDWVNFSARFSGVSQSVRVPVGAVLALYAQENGQGMMFPAEDDEAGASAATASAPAAESAPDDKDTGGDKPKRGAPHLRVVK